MIDSLLKSMQTLIDELKYAINQDIEDTKAARHEDLLKRNDKKHTIINEILEKKSELNLELGRLIQNGEDVNIYRSKVDELELNLKELYELNRKLATIVLPIRQMYKELLDELGSLNGGQFFDIKA